jgi:DNA-binding CsgD family transcriptional regulator
MIQLCNAADDRFWAKVAICHRDECWLWTASKVKGYGLFRLNGKLWRAPRYSFSAVRGPVPANQDVLHQCDNPRCVNPQHLFLGSHQDNMNDRERKGRGVRHRGEQHGSHKLTTAQVNEILALGGSMKQRDIARRFGVCQRTVNTILRGLTRAAG